MNNPVITSVKNYIVIVTGKYPYRYNSKFQLSKQARGVVILATEHYAKLLVEGNVDSVVIGTSITPLFDDGMVAIYQEQFGNIVSAEDGNIIFPFTPQKITDFTSLGKRLIFNEPVLIFHRKQITEPLTTGLLVIDTMIPLGKGQRQLIIGDRQSGKTAIALSLMLAQRQNNIKFIYVVIGQRKSSVEELYNDLKSRNALKNVLIFYAAANDVASQFYAPYKAMAMAEALAFQGEDVVVIVDDLTKHANIYREIALLLERPVGREAFPSDMFYAHSKFLERAGRFDHLYHNGSISCFPIVETIDEDISNLIASNIISITDGQIFTSVKSFNEGNRPAIDIGLSVSRIGSAVQTPIIKKISHNLSSIYANYLKLKKMEDISFEISQKAKNDINKGRIINLMMNQPGFILYDEIFILVFVQVLKWNWLNNAKRVLELIQIIMRFLKRDFCAKRLLQRILLEGFTKESDEIMKFVLAPLIKYYYQVNKLEMEGTGLNDLQPKIIIKELKQYMPSEKVAHE